ncbi:MAG: hypothetical protein K2J34_00440 [Muribaculaceae bacterium]|nr:hypothetical protein [Muribaculaceae bacterium]
MVRLCHLASAVSVAVPYLAIEALFLSVLRAPPPLSVIIPPNGYPK